MEKFSYTTGIRWEKLFERYILWMMLVYLTDVWKYDFTHAAAIINLWKGSASVLPSAFVYVADAFLGQLYVLLLTSLSNTFGIALLWMSTPPVLAKVVGNCKEYKPECMRNLHKYFFYTALVLTAIGIAGQKAYFTVFKNNDQNSNNESSKDSDHNVANVNDAKSKSRRFVVGGSISFGFIIPIIAILFVAFVKSWDLYFGIMTIFTFAILLFTGIKSFKNNEAEGSELTPVLRVVFDLIICNMFCKLLPSYQNDGKNTTHQKSHPSEPSEEDQKNRREPNKTTEEDAKICLRMIPLWLTFTVFGLISSIGETYFLEQATNMEHSIAGLKMPLILLLGFYDLGKSYYSWLCSRISEQVHRKRPKNVHHVPAVGMAVAMVFALLCCITAAKVETRRLRFVRIHKSAQNMNVLWLLPQFILLAAVDGIREYCVQNLVLDQAPKSLSRYFRFFQISFIGIGYIWSMILVIIVGKISQKMNGKNWFQTTLNKSRLDKYYWVLAAFCAVNLVVYIVVASLFYWYNNYKQQEQKEPEGSQDYMTTESSSKEHHDPCFPIGNETMHDTPLFEESSISSILV